MAWPGSNLNTTNLDNPTDKPADARADLLATVQAVNSIAAARGQAYGVASLDGAGLVPDSQIPDTLSSDAGNDFTFQPSSGRLTVFYIASLQPRTVSQLTALSAITGDVAYCSNGDAGNPCLAVWTGSAWKRIALGTTISAT
jgi:hypothetical protein